MLSQPQRHPARSERYVANLPVIGADHTASALVENMEVTGCKLISATRLDIREEDLITPDNFWGSELDRLKRPCWYPITIRRHMEPQDSKFSGSPLLYSDKSWPVCPGCQRPMHFFLQINAAQLPDEVGDLFGMSHLQIFFCIGEDHDCEVSMSTYEPFSKGVRVRVVTPELGTLGTASRVPVQKPFPELAIVGWKLQADYPSFVDAQHQGLDQSDEEAEFVQTAGFPKTGDKLLGWASWQQGADYPLCPECGDTMRYILQLDSNDNLPFMFGDVGTAHVTQCAKHKDIVTVSWAGG